MPFYQGLLQQKRALSFFSAKKTVLLVALTLCLLGAVACGKRPPQVDAPAGRDDSAVNRVYPNPNMDPAP